MEQDSRESDVLGLHEHVYKHLHLKVLKLASYCTSYKPKLTFNANEQNASPYARARLLWAERGPCPKIKVIATGTDHAKQLKGTKESLIRSHAELAIFRLRPHKK